MPDQKPTLEYATPEPPKRPRFLEKLNPKATWKSVARKAIISGLAAAVIWRLVSLLSLLRHHNWHFEWWAFVGWVMVAMIVGAVYEWQPLDDD